KPCTRSMILYGKESDKTSALKLNSSSRLQIKAANNSALQAEMLNFFDMITSILGARVDKLNCDIL
ncbi:hypothetical protein, partial [Shewanella sp. 10N.286.54.B9]|uniref:hypothetical protein n=1 Tax=Shewanella sp. 10N.286.54.B9 TaxID=3229719 RepID=UPI0035505374